MKAIITICRQSFAGMLLVTAFLLAFSAVLKADDHVSLYKYGQTVNYCSQIPCGSAGNCKESAYPCSQDYPYKYTDKVAGFRDTYDLTDSSILCGREDDNSCSPAEKSLVFDLVTLQGAGLNYVSRIPKSFRLYIPPGTFHGKISIYVPHNVDKGVVVRYKQPPRFGGAYADISQWDSPDAVTLDSLTQRDIFLQRKDGMIDGVLTFSGPPMSEGGWLYFRVLSATYDLTIHKIWAKFDVEVEKYTTWYNQYTGWDPAGDPESANNNVAPLNRCSSTTPSACYTESACRRYDGYWYNDRCHNTEPACSSADICGNQADCEDSGFYWSSEGCTDEFPCSTGNLSACNEGDCLQNGGEWDNGSCTEKTSSYSPGITPPPAPINPPQDNSGQTQLPQNMFFQFASGLGASAPTPPTTTAPTPRPATTNPFSSMLGSRLMQPTSMAEEIQCSPEHLEVCDQQSCNRLGSDYWYDGQLCRMYDEHEYNFGSIIDAPVRLGGDVDDGDLVLGDGVALNTHFIGAAKNYAMIVFPDNDFYFISNGNPEELFTKQVVSLGAGGGLLYEHADPCSALSDYQGEWKVYFLTVPASEDFQDLADLESYFDNPDAKYTIGSYTVTVDCRQRKSGAEIFMRLLQ